MMDTFEFKCTPPNERSRIIKLQAATLEEAVQRAGNLWMHQAHPPKLLCIISGEPIVPLIRFG